MVKIYDPLQKDRDAIDWFDFIKYLDDLGDNPLGKDIDLTASKLKQLSYNRDFLLDLLRQDEFIDINHEQYLQDYTSHVCVLHVNEHYIIRCVFWQAKADFPLTNSPVDFGYDTFYHDHNFKLLTVGYLGSGYQTRVYNYNYDDVNGFVGEKVHVTFDSEFSLKQHRALLFEKNHDIHMQIPAKELSISLNILQFDQESIDRQYGFDINQNNNNAIINESFTFSFIEKLIKMEVDDSARELIYKQLSHQNSSNNRLALYRSLEMIDGIEIWREALSDDDILIVRAAQYKLNLCRKQKSAE